MSELQNYIDEGRLIRCSWVGTDAQGRETACLLAALSPEVRATESASACPSTLMPQWLAHLTPLIDDAGTAEAWPGMVRRYAGLASRWHVLSTEQWRRLDFAARAVIVREAASHTARQGAVAACERVADLCERVAGGGEVTATEWAESAAAAEWAARESARAAASAAWAARESARAAAEAAEAAAAREARAAAEAAEAAAWAAESAAASQEAADRITAKILDAIEAEISLSSLTVAGGKL